MQTLISKKSVIIGKGNLGKTLFDILNKSYQDIAIRDKWRFQKENEWYKMEFDILHICFPYFDKFVEQVNKYQKQYNPKYTIIHSDVPTGISRKCNAIKFINLGMEASIGGLDIGAGAYVTTPTIKAYLKQKALLGTDNGPVWGLDNNVNGYPAYGVPAANATAIYFGDFSRMAVGQWDTLEIIVDPYSNAKKGLIDLTVIGLFDTGVTNKRAFCWDNDVSAGL